jgi:predicted short-subunit dehydrogenase-like oxidoreductase (DUF2520 family)
MKASTRKIVLIGAGNVATALGKAFTSKREIVQVYSRSSAKAKKLATALKCEYTTDLKKISTEGDIYIIAVKDDAIEKVASGLRLKGKIVVHTSGSVEMNVLKKISDKIGVLYPLQTFSGNAGLKAGVPFCIEGSSAVVKNELTTLVKELKGKAYYINSAQRAELHLAAVFANNFTNHMYAVANDIAEKSGVKFDILLPLIEETEAKLKKQKPSLNQTGPAVRNDLKTLKKHMELLKQSPQQLSLYKAITKSIQQYYAAKEL